MATTRKNKTSEGTKTDTVKSRKRKYPVKFDSEGFRLMLIVGLAMNAVGALILWASLTAPEGVSNTSSLNYSVSKKIVQAMPESTVQWIAIIIGILFILFGVFCIIMAIKIVFQYFKAKAKE